MVSFLKHGRGFYKSVLFLSVPIALQSFIHQSLALTDTVMLGALGQTEMAAVTIANAPFLILFFIMFGFQSGISVLISQYWGKGDEDKINRVLGVGFYTCGAISFLFACVTVFAPEFVLSLWTDDKTLIEIGAVYNRIVGFSMFLTSFTLMYVGAARATENAKLGLIAHGSAMVLNTVLNYILIFGKFGAPALGVAGAAAATAVSRVAELIITVLLIRKKPSFKLDFKAVLFPGKEITLDFFRYSMPVAINETLWGTGMSIYPAIFGRLGEVSVAAYTVANVIDRTLLILVYGFSNAAAVMIGKEVGAGRSDKVYNMGLTFLFISGASGLLSGVLLLIMRTWVLSAFSLAGETRRIADIMLIMCVIVAPFRSILHTCIVGVLRGGGDVKATLLLDVLPLYTFGLPLALIFAFVLRLPGYYVFLTVVLEDVVKTIISLMRIASRRWIKNLTR